MKEVEKIEAVERMQRFINKNVDKEITLYQLANQAGYSPWHSARIFKELVGQSPFEYIRKIRLSNAALALRDSEDKVIDVAFDFMFDSHEGFTRAFYKQFGLTPKKYQESTPPIYLFQPTSVKDYYRIYGQKEELVLDIPIQLNITVEVKKFPKRKLILKRAVQANDYFEYVKQVDCDIWGLLCSIREALYEPVGLWLPEAYRLPGTSYYVQGVEVPYGYNGMVPEGLEIIELQEYEVMLFKTQPFENEQFVEVITGLQTFIDQYSPEKDGFTWMYDTYPKFQIEPEGDRGYMEGIPVKKVKKESKKRI